jgi:hypothetical protein
MRSETWMPPLTPAASSSTSATWSHSLRTSSSVTAVPVSWRRTKSRTSGSDDGRAANERATPVNGRISTASGVVTR